MCFVALQQNDNHRAAEKFVVQQDGPEGGEPRFEFLTKSVSVVGRKPNVQVDVGMAVGVPNAAEAALEPNCLDTGVALESLRERVDDIFCR